MTESLTGATISHAAQMDRIYAVQRHIYDLTRRYYLLGRDQMIAGLAPPPGGRVLELGCGTGRNLVQAARRHPGTMLVGVDISAQMLRSAEAARNRAGLQSRITLLRGDATALDPTNAALAGGFDRVFLSYTVSMIPDWRGAIAQAVALLRPGGSVHIVDFGDQDGLPRWFHAGLRAWLARFHVTPRNALFAHCAELAAREGLMISQSSGFRDYCRTVILRRPASPV